MPKLHKSEAEKAAERRAADLVFVGVTIKTACEISCGTVGVRAYSDGSIEWDYSTGGHFVD